MFLDREDAGKQLASALKAYENQEVVIVALPRGGVVVAAEVAQILEAPLDLILAHKIGHPYQPEYAIAAISEMGDLIGNKDVLKRIDKEWLEEEKEAQMIEIQRKRKLYLQNRKRVNLKDKIVILVDDGIATGLTIFAGIEELRHYHPKKIVIAVPVAPKSIADKLRVKVDDFIALEVPSDENYQSAVGAYYEFFPQTDDKEVIKLLQENS